LFYQGLHEGSRAIDEVAIVFMVHLIFLAVLAQVVVGLEVDWNYTGVLDIVYKGVPRSYHVIYPESYAAQPLRTFPAILFLHGNGADAAAFALETNMTQEAPRRGYFLVFPEGVQTPNSTLRCRERSWNAGSCCDEAVVNKVDDVAFIEAVLKDISRLRVDPGHVFVAGSSNGGSMALRLACELPHYFAGVAAEIASFELRDGTKCGTDCEDGGDGYSYCDWDAKKHDCSTTDWAASLPSVYECKVQAHPVPVIFFNGRLDPLGNVSGQVSKPVNSSIPFAYSTSFPPMDFAYSYFAKQYCEDASIDKAEQTYHNGTSGNSSSCYTWHHGCTANVTFCLSDAGHRWYGDQYNRYAVCRWEGYEDADCNLTQDLADYGPNTQSLHATWETLDFFDRASRGIAWSTMIV